ncbi:MAG TPA: DMT family transporter [Pseudonocardiaceae bacterium]|jgi:uncharacterized membrane protein|nr:DMT family transporter [Pseudonocardiaceae bacterium]
MRRCRGQCTCNCIRKNQTRHGEAKLTATDSIEKGCRRGSPSSGGRGLTLGGWDVGRFGVAACYGWRCSLIWGSSFVWIKIGLRAFTPMQVAFLRLLFAAGVLGVICRLRGLRMPREPVVWAHSVIVLGVFGTGIAYILNYRLIADDGPIVASTVTYLIPVVAILFGVAVLGESLNLRVLAGMVVVLAGVGLVRRTRPPVPVAVPETSQLGTPASQRHIGATTGPISPICLHVRLAAQRGCRTARGRLWCSTPSPARRPTRHYGRQISRATPDP